MSNNATSQTTRIDEATLPEGVDPENVRFDEQNPHALAFDTSVNEPGEDGAFNPQNGRWYRKSSQRSDDFFEFNKISSTIGTSVECAYGDCGGRTDATAPIEIMDSCPECEADRMGREHFTHDAKRRSRDHSHIANQTAELGDEFAREMQRLREAGVGPTPAMDYLMCSIGETGVREWAEARGVKERTVRRSMKQVANALGETVRFNR